MKNIKLSSVTMLILSSMAMAGGDIAPVEPIIDEPIIATPIVKSNGLYIGLGYSCMQMGLDTPDVDMRAMSSISGIIGYDVNSYFAIEGRYTKSLSDINYETWTIDEDRDWDMSSVGIYLKPKYAWNKFGIYGLLGYGQVKLDNGSTHTENGLQYGVGVNVAATEKVDVYVDYRRLYDDTNFDGFAEGQDVAVNSFTVGVNYKF